MVKEEAEHWYELYNDFFNDDEKRPLFYTKAKELVGQLKEKLKEIIHLMNKNQESHFKMLNLIKEQMQSC